MKRFTAAVLCLGLTLSALACGRQKAAGPETTEEALQDIQNVQQQMMQINEQMMQDIARQQGQQPPAQGQ